MTIGAQTNVVQEIAARRRKDLDAEWDAPPPDLTGMPAVRPVAERLAAPGLHIIAEVKRSSPSAGRIAGERLDLVAQARAYEAG